MRRRNIALLGILGFFALAAGVMAGLIQLYLSDLPQIRFLQDYRPRTGTRLFDAKGRLISELYIERRQPIQLSQISQQFVNAIVAVEDERFFEHVGVDFRAILRALLADLLSRRFAQGGSTITQQLTRNLFLESDKSLRRKVKEAILSVQIENHYTKSEIMELYCNQIYLGGGVYGVEAAARKYFGRSASELTLPQAALLAGLPRAPSAYDPLKYPERARQRRSIVLLRMLAVKAISAEEYQQAMEAPLGIIGATTSTAAPYFVEHIRQYLEDQYGYAAVYQEGLEVYTTLDLDMQAAAEKALRSGLEALDKEGGWRPKAWESEKPSDDLTRQDLAPGLIFPATVTRLSGRLLTVKAGSVEGTVQAGSRVFPYLATFSGALRQGQTVLVRPAGEPPYADPVPLVLEQRPLIQGSLIALDPATGQMRALVGGYDFSVNQFNRATQARRQPGSGIKPFIYASAIESGFTPSSIIEDSPVEYWDPLKNDYWKPQNYDDEFWGDTTLEEGITHSRNVVTVKLLNKLGVNQVTSLIRRLGISSPMQPNLSLALGTSEVNLLELTSAYSVFGNGGIRSKPMDILSVRDRRGKVLEQHQPQYQRVLDPDVAFVVLDMLRSVVNYGTGTVARQLGYPVAAKTGTTNNYQDAWFIGFSPALAAGVWVGYDDNRPMGRGATGGRYAGPIWTDFMERVQPVKPDSDFQASDRIVFKEIDVKTGFLSGRRCPGGRLVAFIKGTEPQRSCDAGLFDPFGERGSEGR